MIFRQSYVHFLSPIYQLTKPTFDYFYIHLKITQTTVDKYDSKHTGSRIIVQINKNGRMNRKYTRVICSHGENMLSRNIGQY